MDSNNNLNNNQSQLNINNNTFTNTQKSIDNTGNNYINGGKGGNSMGNNYYNNNPYYNNQFIPPLNNYIPLNNGQINWNQNGNQNQLNQNIDINSNEKEFILLDGSSPNKKRKYVFVEEIDVPQPIFSLEDIRKIVSDEFDRRFGEDK